MISKFFAIFTLLVIFPLVAGLAIWSEFYYDPNRFDMTRETTTVVYGMVQDGYLTYKDTNYTFVWENSTAETLSNTSSYNYVGQDLNAEYDIYRDFLYFDVGSAINNAPILSARLELYCVTGAYIDFNVTIQNGQPTYPHNPLETGDYAKGNYSGNYGMFDTDNIVTSAYNSITINDTSIIDGSGVTKLALRSDRDINGTIPTDSEYFGFYSYEHSGSDYVPVLIITHRPPYYPVREMLDGAIEGISSVMWLLGVAILFGAVFTLWGSNR